jgi:hypothetical protein
MNRRSLVSLLVASLVLVPASALAQATRTWVSGVGDDANPCSRTAPCKTFSGALPKTAAGGEIDVLDPGGYGSVTINKSITIDGSNTLAGVLVAASSGIIVNAAPTDVVVLRGLDMNGLGQTGSPGITGVRLLSASKLRVERCLIYGFQQGGIKAVSGGSVEVEDSTIEDTAEAAIVVGVTAGPATVATVNRSHLAGGVAGVSAAGPAQVTVRDSVLAGFSVAGVNAADTAAVNVERSLVTESVVGVQAAATATVRLSEVMLSHNGTGLTGPVASFGNNRISAGNGTDGSPATTVPLQ